MLIRKDFKRWNRRDKKMKGLRVLLIRKDFKPVRETENYGESLRVLLIRKDFKPISWSPSSVKCLRVLLIRKDFKQHTVLLSIRLGLRVLLIRKDFKRNSAEGFTLFRLRVLLIRKDFKQQLRCCWSQQYCWYLFLWQGVPAWQSQRTAPHPGQTRSPNQTALACTSSWNAMTPALSPFGDSWIMKDWYAKKIVTFENRNMEE